MGFHKLLAKREGCVIKTTKQKQVLKTEQHYDNNFSINDKYVLKWLAVQTKGDSQSNRVRQDYRQ